MANLQDFSRLSNFVNGIVDRKVRPISLSITSSAGYLKNLATQALGYATSAQGSAAASQASAADADGAASSSITVWNNFTSTYLGLVATDPTKSSIGGNVNLGAFYIRSTDGRLRYASSINATTKVPTWADATVLADAASVVAAANGKFLSLSLSTIQNVAGPVTFGQTVLVPKVTSWSSQQAVTATDVTTQISAVTTSISSETTRATAAEANLGSSKADKTALATETTRATAAEASLSSGKANASDLAVEVNRATAAENGLNSGKADKTALTTETNRAISAENGLNSGKVDKSSFSVGSNANGMWEHRPNGILDQWGDLQLSTSGEVVVTITLAQPHSDTNYNIAVTPVIGGATTFSDVWIQEIRGSKTTTGFQVQVQGNQQNFNLNGVSWRTIGFG